MSNSSPEDLFNKASQAEFSGDLDTSFALYLRAAQGFLHISRTTPAAQRGVKEESKSAAEKALKRAERIKTVKKERGEGLKSVSKDRFSKESQHYVLKKASKINATTFEPWVEDSSAATSTRWPSNEPKVISTLSYSALALPRSDKPVRWARPRDVSGAEIGVCSPSLRAQDLLQGNPTDCSVIASLAVCLDHHAKFNSKLGLSALFPQDADGFPQPSPAGLYRLKLLLNGVEREISFDDQLPFDSDDSLVCADTTGEQHLWPALMEKGYLVPHGGYEFSGSNSSIDLYALTGWIPEYISFQSPSESHHRLWKRIYSAHQNGQCLLTLGTSNAAPFGLTTNHSYAIIKLDDDGVDQKMTLLNLALEQRPHRLGNDIEIDDRELQVYWDDVSNGFDSLSINWDYPSLFKHSVSFHGSWAGKRKERATNHMIRVKPSPEATSARPRATPSLSLDNVIWCLLTRHIRTTKDPDDFVALHASEGVGEEADPQQVHIAAAYSDSQHVLTKITLDEDGISNLIASRWASTDDECGYTLRVFSPVPIMLEDGSSSLDWSTELSGSLNTRNSGGNPSYPTFMINPQYALTVHPTSVSSSTSTSSTLTSARSSKQQTTSSASHELRIALQGADKDVPLNVKLLWGNGNRIIEPERGDVIADSGEYRYGFGFLRARVKPGRYTVALSAYEPRHTTDFTIHVESSTRVSLDTIPAEGAGLFSRVVKGSWLKSAKSDEVVFKLSTSKPVELQIRLQVTEPSTTSMPLRVSLHGSRGESGPPLVSSGDYRHAVSGVMTPRHRVPVGMYFLSASKLDRGTLQANGFRLIVYSSGAPTEVAAIEG